MSGLEPAHGVVIVLAGTAQALVLGSNLTQVGEFIGRITGLSLLGDGRSMTVLRDPPIHSQPDVQGTTALPVVIASLSALIVMMTVYLTGSAVQIVGIAAKSLSGSAVSTSPETFGIVAGLALISGWTVYFHLLRALDAVGSCPNWSRGLC